VWRWKPVVLLLLTVVFVGCRDDTVQVAFRPEVGAVYRYEVRVRSTSEVQLPGQEAEERSEEIVLQSEHTVLDAGPDGVRVQVILGDATGSVRTFVVRFDRAAQLESVESEDTASLGPATGGEEGDVLGLSEIFPAAAVAPPDEPLSPGERWVIDDRVVVPGAVDVAHLSGVGRLRELGIEDDVEVARLATSSVLQLSSERTSADGERVVLEGAQVTQQQASRDLRDGAVRSASSTTTGTYDLEIRPPFDQPRDSLRGTLVVKVTSTTTRLD
jgi:hypothetical protein